MESLFQEGMSWGNRRQWVADHIIPYAAAATPEDVKGLSYYRNVRPVWPRQNIDKGAKVVPPTGVAAGGEPAGCRGSAWGGLSTWLGEGYRGRNELQGRGGLWGREGGVRGLRGASEAWGS